ncbi:uncharacterized protein Z518_11079 [Rhinocladiella mackenziei CBS 650.93]|uniref:tRNA-splicing endonuclease subunit Sen15 domain-containing protein n=1 Tax=Rhinocladiella mackenziei CBS 650.93 TaxID=1442369 RepID=A0A0D2FC25_9EURO|nr:uncharacterized protein Z518_11079 [Rhinocladiella mackenziei CBS 650.93]KIW99666.1 hypothetical protein Z518_11079 [Rhinocladiella mackenziei CBS 650.93]
MTSTKPPQASALSGLISGSDAKSPAQALSLEILHNLQHQHNWTDLKLHLVSLNATSPQGFVHLDGFNLSSGLSPSSTPSPSGTSNPLTPGETVTLISGLPPQHSYVHPDLQTYLIKHSIPDTSLPVQRELVLPLSLGENWTLSRFCAVFDHLPERQVIHVQGAGGSGRPMGTQATPADGSANGSATGRVGGYEHRDQKRVLLGMKARDGGGGDGTVVYYIMQEGEIKPRQNG